MKDLKCKICGGNLELLPNGDYQCDSCGAIIKKASLDARRQVGLSESEEAAKKLMEQGSFDSAYSIYENILTQKEQDAEARWNLLLCRYGVLFQFDELTREMLPTVNRMRYDSILEDPDYLAALKYASEDQKEIYLRMGRLIADIQKRYLTIANREEPYDVFISFKAENEDGTRSRDSVIGQEIYNHLTEHGLRVFYSRITLENKGGEEFEPYIFSALNTAKVMLLIGTKKEHVLAPWVTNEWKRYLALMQAKPGRSLLPVYEEMELSEFPHEIPTREAVNFAKQGALLELTQGVLSITGKGVLAEVKESRSSIAKLTEGLQQSVERGDFSHARELANTILDLDAENSDAYYYLLLANFKVRKATELSGLDAPWTESRNYIRALKYADPARKQLLGAVKQQRNMRLEEERNNRIRKAEAERRKQALSKIINEGKQKIEEKDYGAAFQILSENTAGSPEIDKLIEISKKGMEAQKLFSDKNFLENALKRAHPNEYLELQRLQTKERLFGDAIMPPPFWCFVSVVGIAAFLLAFYIGTHFSADSRYENFLGAVWNFVGPIVMLLLIILGIVLMAAGLINAIRGFYGRHMKKKYEAHKKEIIEPLEKAELEQIRETYEPWLGKAFDQMLEKALH